MAAVSSTPGLPVDDSLNLITASPGLLSYESPCGTHALGSPAKRTRTAGRIRQRESLGPKDVNGGEGLLVDFGQGHGLSPAAPTSLHPRTPSAFARSLLDKSPSLFKAQLSTPLIPLGTPVTTRKKASTSPSKENATPSVRRSARHAHDSPSPAETLASTSRAAAGTPVPSVRFSPSPRRTRSSPRKKAAPPAALVGTSIASTSATTTTPSTSSRLATPLHRVGLATPSAASAAHPLASPFPHFSPSTPAIRTHTSYDTDELTDADADGSIWEDEPSMSYPAPPDARVDEVALAVSGLTLSDPVEPAGATYADGPGDETEHEADADSSDGELSDGASSDGESTETEVATSEDEADEPIVADATTAPDSAAVIVHESPSLEEQNSEGEEVDALVLTEPTDPTVAPRHFDAAPTSSATAVQDGEEADADQANQAEQLETEQADFLDPSPADPEPTPVDPSVLAEPVEVSPEAQPNVPEQASQSVDAAAEDCSGADVSSELLSTSEAAAEETRDEGASDEPASPLEFPAETVVDTGACSTAPAVSPVTDIAPLTAPISTPAPLGLVAAHESTPPSSPTPDSAAADEPATPPSAHSLSLCTPSPARPAVRSSPPRATTPSAARQPQPSVSAAPTARRQLTKLTSSAASRVVLPSVSTGKPALTALVPGSAASSSRRLVVPSRLAVPTKRTLAPSTTILESSPAPPRTQPSAAAADAPQSVELKRPPSALSASSASTASSGSTPAAGSLSRPRPLIRSGLKPPGTATVASGLARPTLTSSARATTMAPPPARTATAPSSRLTRPLTVPRAAPGAFASKGSRLARSETSATATSSRARASSARAGMTLSATASAPSLTASRPISRVPPTLSGTGTARAPRAALAVRQASAAPEAPSQPGAPSPSKARPVRVVETELETPSVPTATSPAVPTITPAPVAELSPPRAETPTLALPADVPSAPILAARSPFPSHALSPPRTVRAPASPLRSPRRVPITSQAAGGGAIPPPRTTLSALIAPAEKLAVGAPPTFFEPVIRSAAPPVVRSAAPRAVRARRTRATEAELLAASVPAPLAAPAQASAPLAGARMTRRTVAAAVAPAAAVPVAPAAAPVVRSARRPTRREPSVEDAQTPGQDVPPPPSSASSDGALVDEPLGRPRTAPQFHPAPSVTQEELNRLTQRNTKKNQQPFNKLKLETVYMDTDRPPSPTSKIRRSFGADAPEVVRAATKEGREARAAKRRNALRASADGSELAALAEELQAENDRDAAEGAEGPREHFRAAGDEEQYATPARAPPLKSKAGAKKRASGAETPSEGKKAPRSVRWDRALVYDGAKEDERPVPDASILKPAELDTWGNSTTATTSFGKAVPVVIRMRVFKDDE